MKRSYFLTLPTIPEEKSFVEPIVVKFFKVEQESPLSESGDEYLLVEFSSDEEDEDNEEDNELPLFRT